MLRLQLAPNLPPEPGWVEIATPLGATAHVEKDSPAWVICTEWYACINAQLYFVEPGNFAEWLEPLCNLVPVGLSAELLMSAGKQELFTVLLAAEPAARAYILALPDHCHSLEEEEWQPLERALDIARALEARITARAAAAEAMGDVWPANP